MESTTGSGQKFVVGVQMLFVAFGALVLVPLLTGFDPSIALFTAGIGTLIFQLITKSKVPVFLASSFAVIAPIQIGIDTYGVAATLGGLACAGIFYLLLGGLVKLRGVQIIEGYLPPVVTGPVIMVIGLQLAPTAVSMTRNFGGAEGLNYPAVLITLISLTTTIAVVLSGKGILSLIPIIIGITVGYIVSIFFGVVDFSTINEAAWFSIPWVSAIRDGSFQMPVFELGAILFILPVAITPAIEHVGDILAISAVTDHDYLEDPGLHRTLSGDGVATTIAALLGGPPNTTYSEVTGAVALLKTFDPLLMRIAAIVAIILAFFGKLGAILKSIPMPVMGGILILLFGMIAVIGIQTLMREKVDLGKSRNLVVVAVILVVEIGDMAFNVGEFSLSGIRLAGVIGVLLNIILPPTKKTDKQNDRRRRQKMKRLVLLMLVLIATNSMLGQNFQVHYDFGEDRDYVTTTFEMFKPDDWGSTFWFIDMDYNAEHGAAHRSMSLSYLEIARYLSLPFSDNLTATIQYNDGNVGGVPLGPIWLFGASYPIDLGFITLQTDLLYKYAYDSDAPDAQLTFVWFKPFLEGKISFMGFLDIWTHDKPDADGKELVLLTEPQLWYNFNNHLSVGTEFELSDNFLLSRKFKVMPTLALKWNF